MFTGIAAGVRTPTSPIPIHERLALLFPHHEF